MNSIFAMLGAVNGLLAVALGAFGAHGLKGRMDASLLTAFHTGVTYHMYHALALLAVSMLSQWRPDSTALQWSGWLFLTGIFLFSGSLYVLSITGIRWLGIITPFGGMAFLVAWALLAYAVYPSPARH